MEERWLPCVDDDVANYEISDNGRIRNPKTGRVLKTQVDKRGYEVITINGKNKRIHNLVAQTYLEENHDGLEVMHKDQNRLNNHANNLVYKEHAEILKDIYSNNDYQTHRKRRIRCVNTGEEYSSIEECSKATGINRHTLCKNVNGGIRQTRNGLRFEPIE